jgi:hypothetical protein
MHYMTHKSHRMEKHKFVVTYPDVHFIKSVLDQPEYEKWCDHVSRRRRNGTHYMTHRFHRIQRHKLGITCSDVLFIESVSVRPEHEKQCDHISCPGHTRMTT